MITTARFSTLAACLLVVVTEGASGDEPAPTFRLPVTRDTWFSNVGPEADANLGGAARMKLKSIQEMSLVDLDPTTLRGRVVRSAALHLRSSGEPRLRRVTVGSFGVPWVEGTSAGYAPQAGSSSQRHRRHPDTPWTVPGGDLSDVTLGQGGTTWMMAEASPPDASGWQTIPVGPAIVAGRVAGISEGFFLFDDTGTEWTRRGEAFTSQHFPNRFVMSRESNRASAPYFTVDLGPEDRSAPAAPRDLKSDPADLPAGEARVSWVTPEDRGPAGTIGFFVDLDGRPLPRYLIPLAGAKGDRVRMHLRDLGRAGGEVSVSIRAVDGAGNVGEPAATRVRLSSRAAIKLPGSPPTVPASAAALPRLGMSEVAIVDELDKVQPITGALIPPQPEGYLAANPLWEARSRRVQLHAARNEFVGFQVLVRGVGAEAKPVLSFDGPEGAKIRVEFGRYRHVATTRGPLPDPIEPIGRGRPESVAGARSRSLHAEVYVPHGVAAGEHRGTLTLSADGQSLKLAVALRVWDFTLPDELSFLPEMNCYGLPANERDFYRLAHRHRTVLNRLPYSQDGSIHDGCAPIWDGRRLDWSAWDRRFGPYLDGSAFADLPRRGVPLECFYLPLHENWPTPIGPNYDGGYWADRSFTPGYRRDFVEATRQMAEHFHAKGWAGTLFQGFLNNKVDFKAKGWSRGSSPWLLDEPANTQDFWALRYFGAAFHEGVRAAPGRAKLLFRSDISRPQWQRDILDGLLDYNVVGGALRAYPRIVLDRKAEQGQVVVEYGGSNPIEESNMQPVGWCLDAWSLGVDGVLPWQTVGRGDSWTAADPLALFYPHPQGGEPVPSIRLKAYRRGQQDVEYLTLLASIRGEPRWAVGRAVAEALGLEGRRRSAGGEDAGLIDYAKLRPRDAWSLRVRLGEAISAAHPAPSRRLVEFQTPPRDPSRLRVSEVR